jgi:DNA-binding response OmpR family regulator
MKFEIPSVPGGIKTLLVVDAEVLIRSQICAYLRECGFLVIEAVSSDEAKSALQDASPAVDLVLSDVDLPGSMDGFALAQWIYRKLSLPVLLAASPARAAQAAAELCEAGPMLAKPYDPQILLDQIKRLIASA